MINALCANSMNTADIVIIVVLAVGLLYGLYSGFAKLLGGFFGTLLAIVGALILGFYLCDDLAGIDAFQNMNDKMISFFESKMQCTAYNAKVEGGKLLLFANGEWKGITELETTSISAKFAVVIQTLAVKVLSVKFKGNPVLSETMASTITDALCGLIIFVGGIIVLMIVLAILTRILSGMVEKRKPLKKADRFFGLLLGAVFIVVIVFVVMYIIASIGDSAKVVTDSIADSTVAKWFYENNPFTML